MPRIYFDCSACDIIKTMVHRYLNHEGFTLAAIDDLIARGGRADWEEFREVLLQDPSLFEKVKQVCRPKLIDPYAQRYHFWMRYAKRRTT